MSPEHERPVAHVGDALALMGTRGLGRLPVVSHDDPYRLLGLVRREDIIRAYNLALTRRTEIQHRTRQMESRDEAAVNICYFAGVLYTEAEASVLLREVEELPLVWEYGLSGENCPEYMTAYFRALMMLTRTGFNQEEELWSDRRRHGSC